jgi:hypothetical protein
MPAKCWSSVRSCVARLTRVDSCGRPLPPGTECAYAVTDGYVQINYSPEVSEAEEIELRNACGQICVSDPGCDELNYIEIEVQFCKVDPDIISIMTGYETVLDYTGLAVGNRISSHISCDEGYALETWSRVPNVQCEPGAAQGQWGYFLAPWATGGIIGEFTLENDAVTFSYTGRTKAGSGWGIGPWDVDQLDAVGTPGQLFTPIGPDDHLDIHLVTVAPPEPTCGCLPMPDYSPGSPGELALPMAA